MQRLGKVAQWHDDKGFGFIQAVNDATAARVFFHIHDYEQSGRRPTPAKWCASFPARVRTDDRRRNACDAQPS